VKISVCMATFNGSAYIETQIVSILKQLKQTDQLIIVDDKSTDTTLEIIGNFADPRIQLVVNPKNLGAALTFNRALLESTGDIVFLSDQDDRWHDGKISTVLDVFASTNVDLIVHDAVVIREGKVVHASLFDMAGSSSGVIKNIVSNTFTGCCMAFKREVLREVLPISGHIGIFHDAWIGVLVQYFGYKVSFIHVPLMDFIRHGGNASTLKRRTMGPILWDRMVFVTALVLHIFRVYLKRLLKKRTEDPNE
jgi:glycosyltransferase involved in cell wall biosynthesis